MMSIAEDMRDAMIDEIVIMGGGVSFVELAKAANSIGETKGNYEITIGQNIVLWSSMSADFADACELLRMDGRVRPTPTTLLVYMIDGALLNLPIAKRPPPNGYKKPHWLPVVFNPAEPTGARGKRTQ